MTRSRITRRVSILHRLVVGLVGVLLGALPAPAETIVHPLRPVDSLPLDIFVDELIPVGFSEYRDTLVDLDTRTIRVRFDLPDSPIDPPAPGTYRHYGQVGPLPAGTYTLRVEGLSASSDAVRDLPVEREIVVERGAFVRMPPVVSSRDATVPAVLELFAGCGFVEQIEVLEEERRIEILFLPDCPVTPPPPPTDIEREVDLPGPFAAGDWTVEVVYDTVAGTRLARGATRFVSVADPLELAGGRFTVEVTWEDFDGGAGRGRPVQPPSRDAGLFWFFDLENVELMVKVLDACDVNDRFWVLTAASTNVGYAITVTDQATGVTWSSTNPLGELAPAVIDVEAFACADGT